MRSGLVQLLDRLCSLSSCRERAMGGRASSAVEGLRQRVSSMAWAGFQVLSNRCVMWEKEDGETQCQASDTLLSYYSIVLCEILRFIFSTTYSQFFFLSLFPDYF